MSDNEQQAAALFIEFLRESSLSVDSGSIDAQVRALEALHRCLYEIAGLPGGVGYSVFSNALKLAQSVRQATDNLKRIETLCHTLYDWQRNFEQ